MSRSSDRDIAQHITSHQIADKKLLKMGTNRRKRWRLFALVAMHSISWDYSDEITRRLITHTHMAMVCATCKWRCTCQSLCRCLPIIRPYYLLLLLLLSRSFCSVCAHLSNERLPNEWLWTLANHWQPIEWNSILPNHCRLLPTIANYCRLQLN